ncbi:MAG TPA: hypothetical protein VJR89_22315 [Polyangiales bacterium]|nr:hypothetical protein [Polyangiales bacterium]
MRLPLGLKLGALVLFSAGALLLRYPVEKTLQLFFVRATAPHDAPRSTSTPGTGPFLVAFDSGPSADNLFFPNGESVWQRTDRHQLVIRLGEPDPTLEVVSFSTIISYLDARMNTLYFHPLEAPVSYSQAVSESERLLRRLALADHVDWSAYQRLLGTIPYNREVFVPEIALTSAKLSLFMDCDWDGEHPARAQLAHVQCYPALFVTPIKVRSAL